MGTHIQDCEVGSVGGTPFSPPSPVHMPLKVRLTSL